MKAGDQKRHRLRAIGIGEENENSNVLRPLPSPAIRPPSKRSGKRDLVLFGPIASYKFSYVFYVKPLIELNTENTIPEEIHDAVSYHGLVVANYVERILDVDDGIFVDLRRWA